jgi:hypothetical protein
MTLQRVTDSIIVADIGTAWTRALLIDRVEGAYRFIAAGEAPTTLAAPHRDVTLGVQNALLRLEIATQRRFVDDTGVLITPEEADGRGVDLLLLTTSAAPALKVAVGGLVSRVSVASAIRAAHSTYSTITHRFALDAPEGRWGTTQGVSGVVAQLLETFPDAVVLTGGAEGGSDQSLLEVVEGISLAIGAAQEHPTPLLIFAGNSATQAAVQKTMGHPPVLMSDNLRPTPREERIRATTRLLDQRLRQVTLRAMPGIATMQEWGTPAPIPTIEALAHLVEYLAVSQSQNVLGVDVGAGATTLVATFANRVTQTAVRRDLGLATLPAILPPERLLEWVTVAGSTEALYNQWLNMALFPAQLPMTNEALLLQQGVTRALLQATVREAGEVWQNGTGMAQFQLILGTGRVLRDTPRPAQALAMLIDGVQPIGVTRFYRDRTGMSTAIGALAEYDPPIAAALIANQRFESLGSVITATGSAKAGDEIVRFQLSHADGITEGVVEAGQSYTIPTRQRTELKLQPARTIDIGYGAGVGVTLMSEGDSVGFVIDGRGRPLLLPPDAPERRTLLEEWNRYVGA